MFDIVVMVDWSSTAEPKAGKDSVWIAWGEQPGHVHPPFNPTTRQAALAWLTQHLEQWVVESKKVLVGFDFAYGYPAGFAELVGLTAQPGPRWRNVWAYVHELAGGSAATFDRTNSLDKFRMADVANRAIQSATGLPAGPFYGRPDWTCRPEIVAQLPPEIVAAAPFAKGQQKNGGEQRRQILAGHNIAPVDLPNLAMTMPSYPIVANGIRVPRYRLTERPANASQGTAQETWKLFGVGSVGGQVLTGIPYLYQLITHPKLAEYSRVWPFQTEFTDPLEGADAGPTIVHAEIFPSKVPAHAELPADLEPKDARQVWTLTRQALEMSARGELQTHFQCPKSLAEQDVQRVVGEEGWILFCG